ncbi:MAG: hypothetical protein AAB790_01165 [Patescibacteria group bacterium]
MSETLGDPKGKRSEQMRTKRYPHTLQPGESDLTPAQLQASQTPADTDLSDNPTAALNDLEKYRSSPKTPKGSSEVHGHKHDEESER